MALVAMAYHYSTSNWSVLNHGNKEDFLHIAEQQQL